MTKDNDKTEEQPSPEIQPEGAPKPYQGKVKVQYLNVKEAEEFRERMGLPRSYLVIGNTIKGGRK
jgi:hypothetical protein